MRDSLQNAAFGAEGSVASTVYGTVVVMATLSAAYAVEPDPWRLEIIVVSTVLVLWIAHVYAHGLSESLELRRRLSRQEAGLIRLRHRLEPARTGRHGVDRSRTAGRRRTVAGGAR